MSDLISFVFCNCLKQLFRSSSKLLFILHLFCSFSHWTISSVKSFLKTNFLHFYERSNSFVFVLKNTGRSYKKKLCPSLLTNHVISFFSLNFVTASFLGANYLVWFRLYSTTSQRQRTLYVNLDCAEAGSHLTISGKQMWMDEEWISAQDSMNPHFNLLWYEIIKIAKIIKFRTHVRLGWWSKWEWFLFFSDSFSAALILVRARTRSVLKFKREYAWKFRWSLSIQIAVLKETNL